MPANTAAFEPAPRAAEIRSRLLATAREFERVTGTPFSAIGKNALNDSNFLFRVQNGEDFTMRSYRRVTEWLDRNWPRDTVPPPSED